MIHIVLFEPEIPQNTGNIFRTAMATHSVVHLIKPLGFKMDDKTLLRSGMDYIKQVPYFMYDNLDDFFNKHQDALIYYVTRYSNKRYDAFDYSDTSKDIYFMFGKESTGIPHDVLLAHEDKIIRIPMVKNARTLNLSNCVAIVVYEALRQQSFPDLSTSEWLKGEDFLHKEKKK